MKMLGMVGQPIDLFMDLQGYHLFRRSFSSGQYKRNLILKYFVLALVLSKQKARRTLHSCKSI